MQNSVQKSDLIKSKAKSLGLLDCVILRAGFLDEEESHFRNWLANGMHGEMGYIARNAEKRLDPTKLVEGAKTIIVVLQNYYSKETQVDKTAPVLSKYAYGTDYHFVMKEKLYKELLSYLI